jgi:hypothetical protein
MKETEEERVYIVVDHSAGGFITDMRIYASGDRARAYAYAQSSEIQGRAEVFSRRVVGTAPEPPTPPVWFTVHVEKLDSMGVPDALTLQYGGYSFQHFENAAPMGTRFVSRIKDGYNRLLKEGFTADYERMNLYRKSERYEVRAWAEWNQSIGSLTWFLQVWIFPSHRSLTARLDSCDGLMNCLSTIWLDEQ